MGKQIDRYQQEITACNNKLELEGNQRYQLSDEFLYKLLVMAKTDETINRRLGTLYALSGEPNNEIIKKWLYYFEHLELKLNAESEAEGQQPSGAEDEPLVASAGSAPAARPSARPAARPAAAPAAPSGPSSFAATLRAKTQGGRDGQASLDEAADVDSESPDGITSDYFDLVDLDGDGQSMTIKGMNATEVRDSRVHDFVGEVDKSAYELGNPNLYILRSKKGGKDITYTWQPDQEYGHTWKDGNGSRLLVINGTKIDIVPIKVTQAEEPVEAEPLAAPVEAPQAEEHEPAAVDVTVSEAPSSPSTPATAEAEPEVAAQKIEAKDVTKESTQEVLEFLAGPKGRDQRRLRRRLKKMFPKSKLFKLKTPNKSASGSIIFEIVAKDKNDQLTARRFIISRGSSEEVKADLFASIVEDEQTGSSVSV